MSAVRGCDSHGTINDCHMSDCSATIASPNCRHEGTCAKHGRGTIIHIATRCSMLQYVSVGFTCADVFVNNITQTGRASRTSENVIVVEQAFMSQFVAVSCSVL